MRSLGGVLARGLIRRLEGKGESIPVAHALAIVVSAAARVEAAHVRGARLYATADNVLVRYDGTVEIRGSRVPPGSDPRADVRALGRLLVELLTDADLPGDASAAIATLIDHQRGPHSAAELARALVQLASQLEVVMTQHELGRYARRQIYHGHLDTPAAGIPVQDESGPIEVIEDAAPRLARGSGELRGDDLPKPPAGLDFDQMMRQAKEISAPVIMPAEIRPSARAPSISPVALPAASGTFAGAGTKARSPGKSLVHVFAILMILGAIGFVVCAAYPDAATMVAALFR